MTINTQKQPSIGLGLAALGRPGYINLGHADDLSHDYAVASMQTHAHQVLDAAWAAGVRYFDAARSYGRAEEFLGSWLQIRDIDANEVTVGSKWGYTYTADWQIDADKHEVKEHSLAVLSRQWPESQANLSGYLKLYQIHSATLDSGVLQNTDVLTRLAELKAEGMAIGLSLSGAAQAETLDSAMAVAVDGVALFDCVQATWNILEPSAGACLQAAHDAGLGVIVKEALANGRLTLRNDNADFAHKLAIVQQQATRLETTIDALALAVVLAQPWVNVVLSGAATIEHLHTNLKAIDVVLDAEALTAVDGLAETPAVYWSTRGQLTWN